MSRIVAPFLTRTAYRMYATNAGTEQKAGMAAIKKAAEEQGLRVEKVPAIELIRFVPTILLPLYHYSN